MPENETKEKEVEEQEKKEKEEAKEEPKKGLSEAFGISLADIEEVRLPNGKVYFKFYDPEERILKMIEDRNDGKNLSEQFKEIQQTLSYAQGDNSLANARKVFDFQLRTSNIELSLIPIRDLKGNTASYRYAFENLDAGKKKSIRVLLENMDFLDLAYINIENAIGIDKNGRVIHAQYNYETGKCELKAAEVRNYEDQKMDAADASYVFDIPEAELDAFVSEIDVSSDIPTIQESEEVKGVEQTTSRSIRGHAVNLAFLFQAYQYPEIIERSDLSDFERMLYTGLIQALNRKKSKQASLQNQKQKKLVMPQDHNNQAAFVDSLVLILIAGMMSGMMLMYAIQMIMKLF